MNGGAWWAAVHGVARSWTQLRDFTFPFHFHALEKEMATHSSVLAWRIPGMGEPGGLPSVGSHRVRHDWSDLALVTQAQVFTRKLRTFNDHDWKISHFLQRQELGEEVSSWALAPQVKQWKAITIAGVLELESQKSCSWWWWWYESREGRGGGNHPSFSLSPALQPLTHTEVRKYNLLMTVYLWHGTEVGKERKGSEEHIQIWCKWEAIFPCSLEMCNYCQISVNLEGNYKVKPKRRGK